MPAPEAVWSQVQPRHGANWCHSFSLCFLLTEYVPRALHTIGLVADADNSYTSVVDYIKPVLTKARATSDDVLLDAAAAAATFLDAAWAAAEARLLAAYKSSTKRSASLLGENFRGRVAFDEFKTSMKEASVFIRRFPRASLAMGLSADHGGNDDGGRGGPRGGVGGGGGGGGDSVSRPGSRVNDIVHHTGDFAGCFSFSGNPGSSVYSEEKILAALKEKDSVKAGKGACCLYAVALNPKAEQAWCNHGRSESWRHALKLTHKEQAEAGVVVAHLSEEGVPVQPVGGGDSGLKRGRSSTVDETY